MEGRESFNQLYNNCKRAIVEKSDIDSDLKKRGDIKTKTKITTVRKLVEKNMRLVEQWDKNIIAYYRGLIECDKIVDFPGSNGGYMYSNEYHNYRDYVRNVMSRRYHDLMDSLLKMVYPEFLQKFHKNDPKLKQFIESLPDADVLT
jgi:hypothetical protein